MKQKIGKTICKYCNGEIGLLKTSNHIIGCNLEAIASILEFRGFKDEADNLNHVASKIK